jgi:hypothetical protein
MHTGFVAFHSLSTKLPNARVFCMLVTRKTSLLSFQFTAPVPSFTLQMMSPFFNIKFLGTNFVGMPCLL